MTQIQALARSRTLYMTAGLLLAPLATAEILLLVELPIASAVLHALIVQFSLGAYLAGERDGGIFARLPGGAWIEQLLPLLPALALLSIVRLLSLSLAADSVSTLVTYALVGAASIGAALLTARSLGWSHGDIGLQWSTETPAGLAQLAALGILIGALGYIAIDSDALAPTTDDAHALIVAPVIVLFVAGMEEMVFRGVVQRAGAEVLGERAWLWSSAAYAAMLLGTASVASVLVLGLAGALFGLRTQQTGSLAGALLAHSLLRITLVLVLPAL